MAFHKPSMKPMEVILLLTVCIAHCNADVFQIGWSLSSASEAGTLTVQPGDTVLWLWGSDGLSHNVISGTPGAPDGAFQSGDPKNAPGSVFAYTFFNAGYVPIFLCSASVDASDNHSSRGGYNGHTNLLANN
eukprot:m.135546 g.135546  ORF g.135546 m.135546 type:complete len:132 (-) comp13977_c0_seq1:694-1089(-)